MLHVLIDFWFVRSGKNFFNTISLCSPNPESPVLFCSTRTGDHSSTVAEACAAQMAVCIDTYKPRFQQVNTELQRTQRLGTLWPLVGGRLCRCLIPVLLEARDRLLQKVHGGLDHLVWPNVVHRVSGLLRRKEQKPLNRPGSLGNLTH